LLPVKEIPDSFLLINYLAVSGRSIEAKIIHFFCCKQRGMNYLAAELSRYQNGIFFQSLQSSGVLTEPPHGGELGEAKLIYPDTLRYRDY